MTIDLAAAELVAIGMSAGFGIVCYAWGWWWRGRHDAQRQMEACESCGGVCGHHFSSCWRFRIGRTPRGVAPPAHHDD